MSLLALAWAVVAVLLFVPPDAGRRLVDLDRPRPSRPGWTSPGFWLGLVGLGAVLGVTTVLGFAAGCWASVAAIVGLTMVHQVSQGIRRSRVARERQRVAVASHVIAGQLRAGATPRAALQVAAAECVALEPAVATIAIGGDVADALVRAGEGPGREGLASLGRAWRLGERLGAPITGLAEQVAAQVRADHVLRELVAAELAGPRASAKLLALLPLLGIGLGQVAGGHPVAFLTGNLLGRLCLVFGAALACAGVVWSDRQAVGAEEA